MEVQLVGQARNLEIGSNKLYCEFQDLTICKLEIMIWYIKR